ncbi:HIT family protein [Desulfatitalea tepidiphila]|uniref:HIT family protein n=1 Tax=Desulfatitalea tepidiphila TaxID=1185843 RepID=UPI0006B4EAFF|nr:HIT family protein [Desulfatitalea tepidiphila]
MDECIFCRIVKGEVPANVVYEDELTLAFMDIGQVNPGHTIVALKSHVAHIYNIDDAQAAAAFITATRIAQALKKAMQPAGMTLLQANEAAGWQTVSHFHIHVLPRHADDGVGLTWPAKHPPREKLERYAARIRAAIAETSAGRPSEQAT